MLSDIEIAQQAHMKKITEIAASLGIPDEEIEPYGHYKAKLSEKLFADVSQEQRRAFLEIMNRIEYNLNEIMEENEQ